MFILIKSYFGEVPKRLKGLASNTSRSVTRREGSNPSFSVEKERKTFFRPALFFTHHVIHYHDNDTFVNTQQNKVRLSLNFNTNRHTLFLSVLFSHIPDHAGCNHHCTDDQNHQPDILSAKIHPVMKVYTWSDNSAAVSNADHRVSQKHPYATKCNCNTRFH